MIIARLHRAKFGGNGGGEYILASYTEPMQRGGTNQGGGEDDIPDNAAERSERYGEWDAEVRGRYGITFFGAARDVTALLGLAESDDLFSQIGEHAGLITP